MNTLTPEYLDRLSKMTDGQRIKELVAKGNYNEYEIGIAMLDLLNQERQLSEWRKTQKEASEPKPKIKPKEDFVDNETLKSFRDIDGLVVIEEYLLFKGTKDTSKHMVRISDLEKMAHIHYRLKVNATNKLYVGWYLDKFYHREGLRNGDCVNIPQEIWERVDKLHNEFRKP